MALPSTLPLVTSPVVDINGLRKIFPGPPSVTAVDGIDLQVAEGELFGLLGRNGAGKTTTISIATPRAVPSAGRVHIAGVDVVAHPAIARQSMGVVPQYNTLDRSLTVSENISFHCLFFGFSGAEARARTAELLEQFRLTDRAQAYPQQLSGGLAQRVQIARAIAHRPHVLFLDEPSAGLDPQSRLAMWEAVRALRREGITVVLTTHYMEEADALCDRVAIIDHGRILVQDAPAVIKASIGGDKIYDLRLRDCDQRAALEASLRELPGVTAIDPTPEGLRVVARTQDGLLANVVARATPFGLDDLTTTQPSLETVFIHLTGRELRE